MCQTTAVFVLSEPWRKRRRRQQRFSEVELRSCRFEQRHHILLRKKVELHPVTAASSIQNHFYWPSMFTHTIAI